METGTRDFKALWKILGMAPKDVFALENEANRRYMQELYQEEQIKVYSCLCRSPWCEHCSKFCATANTIRDRLASLQWDRIRQVVLTVSRETDASVTMEDIRKRRAIPKLIQSLGLGKRKWLWVLEFHADGFPHWHLFIENDRGKSGMIGKERIQKLWGYGHVWESYPKDAKHWGAITGYHRKAGYFAGETKKHQLTLPAYLMHQNRVRKFGANFKTPSEEKDVFKKETLKEGGQSMAKGRKREQKPYTDRLKACNTTCKVKKGESWITINAPGSAVRTYASERLESIDHSTFQGTQDETIDFILELPGKTLI